MQDKLAGVGLVLALGLWVGGPAAGADPAPSDPALTALVQALHERGVLDEQQYTEISAKAAAKQAEQAPKWWEKVSVWGDFRARYEGFWYERESRWIRRRIRSSAGATACGSACAPTSTHASPRSCSSPPAAGDNRSANQTFGGNLDWGKDLIEVDLAYVQLTPFPEEGQLPLARHASSSTSAGSPTRSCGRTVATSCSGTTTSTWKASTCGSPRTRPTPIELFANTGYFIDDENASAKDPGAVRRAGRRERPRDRRPSRFGGRVSFFQFVSLDKAFVDARRPAARMARP